MKRRDPKCYSATGRVEITGKGSVSLTTMNRGVERLCCMRSSAGFTAVIPPLAVPRLQRGMCCKRQDDKPQL